MTTQELLQTIKNNPKASALVNTLRDEVRHHLHGDRVRALSNLLHPEFWTEENNSVDWDVLAASLVPSHWLD